MLSNWNDRGLVRNYTRNEWRTQAVSNALSVKGSASSAAAAGFASSVRSIATIKEEGEETSDEGGEEDDDELTKLGPLQSRKIRRKRVKIDPVTGQEVKVFYRPPVEDIYEACNSMTDQLISRVRGISKEVVAEVQESKAVLHGLLDVSSILSKRIKDLRTQQEQVLQI